MRRASWVLGLAALLCACGPSINYDYSKEPDPRAGGYIIGPTDVLQISVWKQDDLSGRIRVRPDGRITCR